MARGNMKTRSNPGLDTSLFPPSSFEQVSSTSMHSAVSPRISPKLCNGPNCGQDRSAHLCYSRQKAYEDFDVIDQIDKLIEWVSNMSTEPVELSTSIKTSTGKSTTKVRSYYLKPLPPLPPPTHTLPAPSSPISPTLATPISPFSPKPAFRPTIAAWNHPLSPTLGDIPKLFPSSLAVHTMPLSRDDLPPFSDTLPHLLRCMRLLRRPLTPTELKRFSPSHRSAHDYLVKTKDLGNAVIDKTQHEKELAETERIRQELEEELKKPHHQREYARLEKMVDKHIAEFF